MSYLGVLVLQFSESLLCTNKKIKGDSQPVSRHGLIQMLKSYWSLLVSVFCLLTSFSGFTVCELCSLDPGIRHRFLGVNDYNSSKPLFLAVTLPRA